MSKHGTSITQHIILATLLGTASGFFLGPTVEPLGVIGTLYIQLIKAVAVPLVFVSIIEALLTTSLSLTTAKRWILVVLINSVCALTIGLCVSNILQPGIGFSRDSVSIAPKINTSIKEFSFEDFFIGLVPGSIVDPFVENNVIGVAFLALLLGAAIRAYCRLPSAETALSEVARIFRILNALINQIVLWLVALVPFAIFCVTAKTVGISGFEPFKGLLKYVAVASLGLSLQILLVYPLWIKRAGGISIKKFINASLKPVAYAFGTNSSLATVPVTLRALDTLGIDKSSSRLATCIGTNFNNDGIILYEAMAVLFVAQAQGIDLLISEQILVAAISLVAAIGVAGVPEAGVVSLSLVLAAVGMPLDLLPLLLTVDWIVARMRSVINVLSDMTVSIAVGRGLTSLSG